MSAAIAAALEELKHEIQLEAQQSSQRWRARQGSSASVDGMQDNPNQHLGPAVPPSRMETQVAARQVPTAQEHIFLPSASGDMVPIRLDVLQQFIDASQHNMARVRPELQQPGFHGWMPSTHSQPLMSANRFGIEHTDQQGVQGDKKEAVEALMHLFHNPGGSAAGQFPSSGQQTRPPALNHALRTESANTSGSGELMNQKRKREDDSSVSNAPKRDVESGKIHRSDNAPAENAPSESNKFAEVAKHFHPRWHSLLGKLDVRDFIVLLDDDQKPQPMKKLSS